MDDSSWDLVIVTARDPRQRWLFERYLGRVWPAGQTHRAADWLVLADPPGPRLGSAGATVHALAAAAHRLRERFESARLLVLHCGGLSQRVPQLSHLGKAFAPGAADDRDGTLFTHVVIELARLFDGMEPGAVIACGDVLYTAPEIGLTPRRKEALAVACHTSAEQASRHGVYLWEPGHSDAADSWQKPDVSRLQSLEGERRWGMDTGVLYLGAAVIAALLRAIAIVPSADPAGAFRRRRAEWRGLELYRDLTPPMTSAWRDDRCLPGSPGAAQRALSRFPLRVTCPEGAVLHHYGTSAELLRLVGHGPRPRVHASHLEAGELAAGVVLDRCLAERPVSVAAGSYVSGLNQPGDALRIGAARVVYQLPLRPAAGGRGDVCVALGVGDDAKQHPAEGATLLGQPLMSWLRDMGVAPSAVWEGIPEPERSLWNARLFPTGAADAVAAAVPWLAGPGNDCPGERIDRWRRGPRTSMAEAQRGFDARRWWAHEERIRAHRLVAEVVAAVLRGDGVAARRLLETPGLSESARKLARRRLEALGRAEAASLAGARAWLMASTLASPAGAITVRERGFRTLGRALVTPAETEGQHLAWQLAPGEFVEAHAPVRVDLVGGWTDTPPQACERGGAVLNVALQLDGRRPLLARVERLPEPVVDLVARDLGERRTLSINPPPRQRPDPRDPFALHLAGLRLVGLFGSEPLSQRLRRLGGGLRLTTAALVPKGSGLGSSSILGAAVLAALSRAFGREAGREALCRQVLLLEQLMGTGGGWQDQVGGMWGGVKLATSAPGLEQRPQVEPLRLSEAVSAGLAERMVVFYTGEPRLAKDVLQRVVAGYLTSSAATLAVLEEMPALAHHARSCLLRGDWDGLGRCLTRSWELNRQLEPTSSNATLDALFERMAPHVAGAKLAGAGGGGFLFALAHDRAARARLEALLDTFPSPARRYDATLDLDGLVFRGAEGRLPPRVDAEERSSLGR